MGRKSEHILLRETFYSVLTIFIISLESHNGKQGKMAKEERKNPALFSTQYSLLSIFLFFRLKKQP